MCLLPSWVPWHPDHQYCSCWGWARSAICSCHFDLVGCVQLIAVRLQTRSSNRFHFTDVDHGSFDEKVPSSGKLSKGPTHKQDRKIKEGGFWVRVADGRNHRIQEESWKAAIVEISGDKHIKRLLSASWSFEEKVSIYIQKQRFPEITPKTKGFLEKTSENYGNVVHVQQYWGGTVLLVKWWSCLFLVPLNHLWSGVFLKVFKSKSGLKVVSVIVHHKSPLRNSCTTSTQVRNQQGIASSHSPMWEINI